MDIFAFQKLSIYKVAFAGGWMDLFNNHLVWSFFKVLTNILTYQLDVHCRGCWLGGGQNYVGTRVAVRSLKQSHPRYLTWNEGYVFEFLSKYLNHLTSSLEFLWQVKKIQICALDYKHSIDNCCSKSFISVIIFGQ